MDTHESLASLLHRGDVDELVRAVDRAAARRDWKRVGTIRRACLEAVEATGRQVWGPAAFAAYRLALEAPAELAVSAMLAGHDRHTLGPLTEVIAQYHTWEELVPWLPGGPVNAVVATERVARGEDLTDDSRAEVHHLDVAPRWQAWEGRPALPTYRPDSLLAPAPTVGTGRAWTDVAVPSASPRPDVALVAALEAIAEPWATASTGEVSTAVVDGPAAGAIAAVAPGPARARPIGLSDAVAWLTWAAASGGALGRRRGLAAGRSTVWWLLRTIVGDLADPAGTLDDPDELEFFLAECSFVEFDTGADHGWRLQVAVAHPSGHSIAIHAHDQAEGGFETA